MKTTLQYIVLLLLFTNCKAQHNPQQTITMKTFDIENFEKHRIGNEYMFFTKDNVKVIQREWQDEYEDIRIPKDSYIELYTSFYKNGKVKMEVSRFPNQFLSGVMKEYDEQGHLIKETDYDAPYKFTWEDILAFIKKRNIDMNDYYFEVRRGHSKKGASWSISYGRTDGSGIQIINIDGITGEVTREIVREYPVEE